MPMKQSRRRFLTTLSIAGAAGLVRMPPAWAAEGALETTTIRIFGNRPALCVAPQYVAEELLHGEGFTDVRYVGLTATTGAPAAEAVGSGDADFTVSFAAPLVPLVPPLVPPAPPSAVVPLVPPLVPPPEPLVPPFGPPLLTARFSLTIDGVPIALEREVVHRHRDEVLGEVRRPLRIVPAVEVAVDEAMQVWPLSRREPKNLRVVLTSHRQAPVHGRLEVESTLGKGSKFTLVLPLIRYRDDAFLNRLAVHSYQIRSAQHIARPPALPCIFIRFNQNIGTPGHHDQRVKS